MTNESKKIARRNAALNRQDDYQWVVMAFLSATVSEALKSAVWNEEFQCYRIDRGVVRSVRDALRAARDFRPRAGTKWYGTFRSAKSFLRSLYGSNFSGFSMTREAKEATIA